MLKMKIDILNEARIKKIVNKAIEKRLNLIEELMWSIDRRLKKFENEVMILRNAEKVRGGY